MMTSMTTRTPLLASLLRQQRDADDAEHVLVGCSLPPKVTGVPRGAVLLSVPRILSSVAAEAVAENGELRHTVLPRVALVRVRWWGEEKPGSTLFRPKFVAQEASHRREDDEQEHSGEIDGEGDSSLCMRYPVCVPAQQLLDYLRDMKELVLDVIDRETRKKIGRGVFPFQLDKAEASSPVDTMKKLGRTDALCEIHATAPPHAVLGYLTVNFEIEWTPPASTATASVSTPLKWTNSATSVPAITVNPAVQRSTLGIPQEPERRVQQRLSFSSMSSSSSSAVLHDAQPMPMYRSRRNGEAQAAKATRSVVGPDRLEALLEKGRALQRSMSVATKNDEAIAPNNTADRTATGVEDTSATTPSSPLMSMAAMLAPYEALTEDVDNDWEHVLKEAENTQVAQGASETRTRGVERMKHRVDSIPVSLGEHNALEISFETMEFEQETIDRLRQLREGSVSTRFSPIELVVSHEHPRFVFSGGEPADKDKWIAAFAVNSSLRKRQWRTNYSHTLPLYSHEDMNGKDGRNTLKQRMLRFRVRCEPQHSSPTGKRRRDTRQRLDLWTEVPVDELLESRERERVVTLALRLPDDSDHGTKKRSTSKRQRQRHSAGSITVKFRFCTLEDDEVDDTGSEVKSEGSASSDWSLDRFGNRALDQKHSSPSRKQPRSPLLAHLQARDTGTGVSLFFALLIDRATIRLAAEVEDSLQGHAHRDTTTRSSLRLDYGTPAFFGCAAKTLRLKRSAKARLRRSENGAMRAAVNHMNAFPIEVSNEFLEKIDGGLLILEVWLQEQSKTLTSYTTETLLGVVKVPLRSFSSLMRNADQLNRKLQRSTPFIGIDQDLPIIDPLTDNVNGQIHVRVGLGTAEQLFHFKSTLAAVVKLQSHVRGWLARRALQYWQQFELVDHESHEGEDQVLSQSEDMNTSETSAAEKRVDTERASVSSGHEDSVISVDSVWHTKGTQPIARVEVQVEIRESYGKKSRKSGPLIGCEVYGLLRVQEDNAVAALFNSSGPRFTLWWDTQDAQLNSHFVHSFQAADPVAGIHLQDIALLFRIEPQFALTHRDGTDGSAEISKGVAAIDLAAVAAAGESVQCEHAGTLMDRDIDIPIEWSGSSGAGMERLYASTLPLRIGLQLSRRSNNPPDPEAEELLLPDESHHSQRPSERITTLQTASRTERLLPATLRLCLDVQRVSDMKELVLARHATATRRPNESQIEQILGRAIQKGVVKATLLMSLCLGTELHTAEKEQVVREAAVIQNHRGVWFKHFRFGDLELEVRDGVQSLPSITQGDVEVMVHPELVSFLQEGSLDVRLLLDGDDEEKPSTETTLGTVSIPLAPILFRPSGVQGSFPVHVCDDVLSGRIGVHLYIEQENSENRTATNATATKIEESSGTSVASEQSRRSSLSVGSSVVQSITQEEEQDGDEGEKKEEDELEDGEHEPWFSELSMAEAVGSMHKTSRSIDDRLARMATQSLHSDAPVVEHDPTIDHGIQVVEQASLGLYSEPAAETIGLAEFTDVADEEQHQEREASRESQMSDCASPTNEQNSDAEDAASGGKVEEDDCNEADDEESFYKPITLESLGIGEIELSPITDLSASPLPGGSDVVSAASPGFQQDGENGDDDEDELRQELDDLSEPDRSTVEGREPVAIESDVGDDEIDMSQLEIRSPGPEDSSTEDFDDRSMASVTSSPRGNFVDSSFETTDTTEEVSAQCGEVDERHSDTTNDDEGSSVPLLDVGTRGVMQQDDTASNATDIGDEVTVDETTREDVDTDDDTDSHASNELTDPEDRASEDNSRDVDHGAVAMADTDSNVTPDQQSIDGSCVIKPPHDGVDTGSAAGAVSLTPAEPVRSIQLAVCDDSTQTEESAVHLVQADTSGELPSESATLEAQVSSEQAINSESQTAFDAVADVTTIPPKDSATVTTDQGARSVERSVAPFEYPAQLVDNSDTSPTEHSGQQLALPAEKLNLAWQLLTEIRALYVDTTSVELPQSMREAPAVIGSPVNDSRVEKEAQVQDQAEQTTDVVTSIPPQESMPMDTKVAMEKETSPRGSGAIWQWRDEASLRAEVNERLRQSQHEYEEALALSQSMNSVKSWSSSFVNEGQRQQVEQITSDLSASALEKRQRNARAKLFRADTETERIARIMQGSLSYWIPEDEDEDSAYEDETSDGDDEDTFGYF